MQKINSIYKYLILILLTLYAFTNVLRAEIVKEFDVLGNERISKKTIIQFSGIKKNDNVSSDELNDVIKKLYETDFFSDIKVNFKNGIIKIIVEENPVIQSLQITGIKKKSLIEFINDNLILREKNSYVENTLKKDEEIIYNILRTNGYYFSEVITKIQENDNNTIDLIYEINLGEKAFIKKIKFLGDKKFKERKLKNIIVSEEYKFWKFISNKKFIDIKRIELDKNLLRSFYKNNGYFNVSIESSTAKLINESDFELTFNINAGKKYFFNNVNLNIPTDYSESNFSEILELFSELKGKIYSLNSVEKIINQIDKIVLQKEFEFISASYNEKITSNNKIDIDINLNELEKNYIQRINIYGNYITEEKVIRNALIIDEGDPLNDILINKSMNEIKSLNIFGKVDKSITDGDNPKQKIVNISLEEKPTGEISAGVGTGTTGSTLSAGIKENNYLGRGIKLKSGFNLSADQLRGSIVIDNPNYKNSDRSLRTTIESVSSDYMAKFGYKSERTGFSFGTTYEQYDDIFFSPALSLFYEDLETSSAASTAKKKQAGSYLEAAFNYAFTLNKLNQNFQPTDGYTHSFSQTLPLMSDDYSLENAYHYSKYYSLENDMVLSMKFFVKSVNALNDKDARLTKRIFIPSRRLRGFESGKIGPKDSGDFIGGNYGSAVNFSTTIPQLLQSSENLDVSIFLDAANIWGVDYDSNLNNSKLRSATGIALDWFTPIGPLSFSFSQPITKSDTDIEEKFRFQIGTTF